MRFSANGEVTFSFPVPGDIEYSIAPRVRLVWGIKSPNAVTIDAIWQIRSRFAEPDLFFPPFSSNSIAFTQSDAVPGMVYATQVVNLTDLPTANDVFGVIRVKLSSINPSMDLHLMHIDLEYVANRLGRPLI